eukprot:1139301-Pelagomonas_calceolata.AAC.2
MQGAVAVSQKGRTRGGMGGVAISGMNKAASGDRFLPAPVCRTSNSNRTSVQLQWPPHVLGATLIGFLDHMTTAPAVLVECLRCCAIGEPACHLGMGWVRCQRGRGTKELF